MIYALAFYIPAAILALCSILLLFRAKSLGNSPLLWAAIVSNAAAAFVAIWAMLHRSQLRARSYLDYRYEVLSILLSLSAFAFSFAWTRRPGQKIAWLPTLSAAWLALLWFIVITTQI